MPATAGRRAHAIAAPSRSPAWLRSLMPLRPPTLLIAPASAARLFAASRRGWQYVLVIRIVTALSSPLGPASRNIQRFTAGRDRDAHASDPMLRSAVERLFEIVGE